MKIEHLPIFKIMRFSLCILVLQTILISFLNAGSLKGQKIQSVHEVIIDLDIHQGSIKHVFEIIEAKTDYQFNVNWPDIDNSIRINLSVNNSSLAEVLMEVSREAGLQFKQVNKAINVKRLVKDDHFLEVEIDEQQSVSGTITDENGESLPGATIQEKGTSNGTITDVEGRFSIDVSENAVLTVSFVGYASVDIPVNGRSQISVQMEIDAERLEEIVVTSFGIKQTKQQLTYATQEVDGDELNKVGNPNMLNGLQGKIAGVNIGLTSGMPGRSPVVKIRGSRSISGNNQPLYVVDGAPISGRIQDLNPSNIESMSILKGPAASALYGLRASNGVIIITTKKGKSEEGKPVVSVDFFHSIDEVSYLPDLQMEYAQGNDGVFNPNHSFSWGPRISDLGTYTNQLGEQEVARAYDNDKEFYQPGSTTNTNVSISNSGEIGSYYLGIGRNNQQGVVPTTSMYRTNVKFNGTYNISERFSSTVSFNFSELNVNDFPDLTGNNDYFRSLRDVPPSYNLAEKPYQSDGDPYEQIYFRSSQNNPYWVVNHNYRNTKTPRTIGNLLLEYELAEGLKMNYRFGLDNFSSREEDFRDLGTAQAGRTTPPSGGSVTIENIASRQLNSNAFLTYNKQFENTLSVDAVIGNEVYDQQTNVENSTGSNLITGGWANLANAANIAASNRISRQRIVGFYANVNLGWQDKFFLNASGRNDYVSNMPSGSRSFFYPSVGGSVILTNVVPQLESVFSFAKLRASFAEVGQAGNLFVNGTGFVGNNPSYFTFPYNGLTSFTQQSTRINPNLMPENTRSMEFGFDFRFMDERIALDYTYFDSRSEGQIFSVPLALSTGAANEIRNAGEMVSSGHEIVLNIIPFRTEDFQWDFITNFTAFENKVVSLAEGVERIDINDGVIVAEAGYDYPSILATGYFKDPETGMDIVLNDPSSARHGMPIMDPTPKIVGSTVPDFNMNFINSFGYKNLTLSVQVDWRSGGQLFSKSYVETRVRGVNGVTRDRDEDVILPAMKGNIVDGNLVVEGVNDIAINKAREYYYAIGTWLPTEQSLQDASFVRLREVSVNYDIPESILSGIFIKSASVYLTGRNLFLITDSFTDPEVNFTDNRSSNTAGYELSQIPQTRSIGGGLRIQF